MSVFSKRRPNRRRFLFPSAIGCKAMIIIAAFFCAAFVFQTGSCAADLTPEWKPLSALPPIEFGAAKQAAADMPIWDADDSTKALLWKEMRASFIELDDARNLLLIATKAFGTCGEFNIRILGPKDSTGNRKIIMSDGCFNDIRFRAHQGHALPDIVTTVSDLTDSILIWDGSGWNDARIVENFKPAGRGGARDLTGVPWSGLTALTGTYDIVSALKISKADNVLRNGIPNSYLALLYNLSAHAPWVLESNCLITEGLASHQGGINEAILALCKDGSVHAAIFEDANKIILFSPAHSETEVPARVWEFVDNKTSYPTHPEFAWLH